MNPLEEVSCVRCGDWFYVPNNLSSRAKYCKNCKAEVRREQENERNQKRAKVQRMAGAWSVGGDYHICKDPDESWSYDASFTLPEIYQMMKQGFLADGTEFQYDHNHKSKFRITIQGKSISLISISNPKRAIASCVMAHVPYYIAHKEAHHVFQ